MAKCCVCEKGVSFGHNVSHSNRKTNRTWKPNIRTVKVVVNGEHKTVRYLLQEGDELSLLTEDTAPSPRIRESCGPIDVLFEDEDLIAVNKPAGMAVHPSKKLQDDTLAGRILYHRYPMVFRAAGRLDKDTSGVVISAKTRVVGGKFFHMIKDHKIKYQINMIKRLLMKMVQEDKTKKNLSSKISRFTTISTTNR